MSRVSRGPRYYESKQAWFANINGERIKLATGPKNATRKEAEERYHFEAAPRKVEIQGDRNIVWKVLNDFLQHCMSRVEAGDMAPATLRKITSVLTPCSTHLGKMLVRDLRPKHITDWLASMRRPRFSEKKNRMTTWGDRSVQLARDVLKQTFRWAKHEAGLITCNPFEQAGNKREKRRRQRPTTSRAAIFDSEYQLLQEHAQGRTHKDFSHLLTFLYRTGARPAEMYLARADEWNEEKKAFVIAATPANHGRFKLAHLGEDRIIYIPDDLVPLAHELMTRYPEGPIFRNEKGRPYKRNTLIERFASAREIINRGGLERLRKNVTAYSLRHAYVTRWLEQDRPVWKLCELINTSENMLRQHYSHLFERTEALRQSLNDFDQGKAGASDNDAKFA